MRKLSIVVLVVVALFVVLLVVFHQRHHAQQSAVSINGERFHVIGIVLGVDLTITNDALEVRYVVPGTLAAKAGLHPGLFIQQIDGTNTLGKPLRECRLMTVGPIGSEIHFVVVDPAKNETNIVEVLRQKAAMRDAD
jgi:C-terminal processing protease CtpA/Prc